MKKIAKLQKINKAINRTIGATKNSNNIKNFFGDDHFIQKSPKVHFPDSLHNLLPYCYYDEDTSLYYNKSDSGKESLETCGFILEASPIIGCSEADIDILSNFFNDNLPEGLILQIINYASPRTGNLFDLWKRERDNEGGIYKDLAEKRINYLNKGRWKSLFSAPFVARDFSIYISASMPVKKYKNLETILKKLRTDFESNLNNINIRTKNVNPDQLLSFLDEILNPNPELTHKSKIKWDQLNPINCQASDSESTFELEHNQVNLKNDISVKSFTVKNYPDVWGGWEMINLLGAEHRDSLRISCPFITSLTIEVPSLNSSKKKAITKEEILNSRATSPMARLWKNVENMAQDWKYVKDHIEKGQRLVVAKFNIIILAKKDEIDTQEERLKAIYIPKGWTIKRDDYLHLPSFLSTLPFYTNYENFKSFKQVGKTKTLLTWTCSNIAPLQGEFKGALDSPYVMLLGKRGQPLFWNPYFNPEAGGNYNVAVTGKAGSGKSVFMQELVASIRGAGGRVFIIDDGESFKNSSLIQGGKFIEIGSNICINPFTMFDWDALKEDSDYKNDIQNFFVSLLIQICRPLTPITEDEKALLESAVWLVINEEGREGNLRSVCNRIPDVCNDPYQNKIAKSLQLSLDVFLNKYEKYFKGESDIKMDSKLLAFELSNLKGSGTKDLKAVVMMIIMHLIGEAIYKGGRKYRSALVIDEAWDLLHGSGMKEFIEGYVRRVRKYGGNLITGTQSINDYYKNPAARAVLENSQWKIFLAQNTDAVDYLKEHKVIKMNSALEESLKRLRMLGGCYSEALIYGDTGWYIGRLILDPFSIFLYSSKAEDVNALNQLKAQGYTIEEAVKKLAGEDKEVENG